MPFVKLDCKILDSTLWVDRDAREIFLTALLMAIPTSYDEPVPTLKIDAIEEAGWDVPPGEYGLVEAASVGICRRAMIDTEPGLEALMRLANPETVSRSSDFDGRRMVRVNGGFLILNFIKYREKDHTAAERQKRYREKKKRNAERLLGDGVTPRNITQAEAEAEAEATDNSPTVRVPCQKIVDLYHEHCPDLPRVKVLSEKRRRTIRTRWKSFEFIKGVGQPGKAMELIKFNELRSWERYFKFITAHCSFMTGKNDRDWVANFDFCIRESGMIGVLENKYVDRK